MSVCSAVWSAHSPWERGVGGSSPSTQTMDGWQNGIAPVSKTVVAERLWGFESLTIRHCSGVAKLVRQ